jgi:hypothetical protein
MKLLERATFRFLNQSELHASRAIDGTVYHNTTGKSKVVVIACIMNYGDIIVVYTDNTATPTLAVAGMGHSNLAAIQESTMFIVLPGNYYKVTSTGSPTLSYWTETS